tara:strand:- start:134 stop:355 length:222 start_codon:yes stop_codon:yes gene_type:complete
MGAREDIAEAFEKSAIELEKAAAHCRIASKRYAAQDVPSGCAHAFASIGHISKANKLIEFNAEVHSKFAQINE